MIPRVLSRLVKYSVEKTELYYLRMPLLNTFLELKIELVRESAEQDEQWSFVGIQQCNCRCGQP